MLLSLFCGIIIAILNNLHLKQFYIVEGVSSTPVISLLINNLPVDTMSIQCTVKHYNRDQFLSLYLPTGISIKLNNKVLTSLKEYGILMYRGKRAGRARTRDRDTSDGVHWSNLTQIELERTIYLNENRKCRLHVSTVKTRSVRGKSTELIQHVQLYLVRKMTFVS